MKKLLCLLLIVLMLPTFALAERPYLIPHSNTTKLTEAELWEWDYESLGYILNEIFARHGYNFEPGKKYDYYFRCMPWYKPNEDKNNQRACYSKLSSVEWYNEGLVKDVRAQMRAMGTQNKKGQSVWDYFSTGFDTLQGFNYVELKRNQKLPVYSAPEYDSWRGAKGKALVSTNGNVFAAGWESGWLLVMYETNKGSVRVGYVSVEDMRGNVPVDELLTFDYLPAKVTAKCTLTDDPARSNSAIMKLKKGDEVTYLSTFFNKKGWDYVETTIDGQTVRGFIPTGKIEVQGEEDPDAEPSAEDETYTETENPYNF